MGRPEPCVLFAQSFIHPHLDEYVDEVRFTEPVVISACEFLEQNASASCSMITLSGASFPPSFALEAFVQCEGETRFRRLCPPFLYSPSSSNMLEVQERCFLPLLAALLSSPSLRSGTGSAMDIFIDLVTTIEAILLSLLFCRSGLQVSAIDRLIGAAHHSEEMLWALWDLCSVSRSEIGRQAVLALGHFPEAISVLMVVLQSGKESEPVNSNNGTCPLSLAIFHAAAELFEVMVTDSTAFTQIADLHKALHSSSPGSNKKDAPSRLLEWVDAAVVYHKKGVIGLLRYAGLLASGGDAQLTSASLLVSDPMDVDNIGADSAGGMDFRPVESLLGKLVSDKTTAMRILSFVSEHPALEVLQDMLRVLIIRMACQKPDHAAVLLRPLLAWIQNHICDGVSISEMDAFKGERLLEFLAGILEHPSTKMVLMKEGLVDILTQALDKKNESSPADEKSTTENVMLAKDVFCLQWYSPIFRSLSLICDPGVSVNPTELLSRRLADCPPFEGWCNIILRLLRFCQVARVGKELQACWDAIVTLASHNLGRAAFAFIALQMQSSSFIPCQDLPKEQEKVFAVTSSDESEDRTSSPLFDCWKNLVAEVEADNGFSNDAIEIIKCFALGSVYLCAAGKSGHGVMALRSLFGLDCGSTLAEQHNEEKLRLVFRMLDLLNTKINESGTDVSLRARTNLEQTRAAVTAMLHLLEKPSGKIQLAEIAPKTELPSSVTELPVSSGELPPHLSIGSEFLMKINKKLSATSDENIGEPDKRIERTDDSYFLGGLADRFMWECPDSSPDRPTMPSLPLKRKTASVEGSNRRQRGDGVGSGAGVETTATSSFVRTGGPTVSSSGQTRRDTFRQRKPNTSRPPSMHVDDYVARERNNDGMSSSSNVATSAQRASSTGGRPPSIHVDEFMARQRERQQPPASAGGDLQQPVQTLPPETESNVDKSSKSRQMKVHLEDDLQEINIELDVVSETDDVFPPSDDCQPAPVILPEENSPDSLVDDTEFNANNSAQFVPGSKEMSEALVDGNNSASLVSREPVTQSESGILRHGSVTSDKGQGKHSTSTETPFRQEQFDNRMPNSVPITSKGYEAVATSKTPPSPLPFYDHGSNL